MGTAEVFEAFGGGIAAVLAVACMSLFGMLFYQLNQRLADRDQAIKERDDRIRDQNTRQKESDARIEALTTAVNRQTETWQSWIGPREQLRDYRRYREIEPGPDRE